MILNEFDVYQNALKKINLNEGALPIYKGRILSENVDTYYKIQKLLNCNPMEKCHRWLYDLDVENLNETEQDKINELYELGIEKGYIDNDDVDKEINDDISTVISSDISTTVPLTTTPIPTSNIPQQIQSTIPHTQVETPTSAYTVVYSAMRNGELKTGEAYSNAINTRSAKADVISKLEKVGYQNISILAIEAGDPDLANCDNTYCKQSDYVEEPNSIDLPPLASTENSIDTLSEEDKEEDKDSKDEDASEEDKEEDKKIEKVEEPDEKLKASTDKEDDSSDEDKTEDNTEEKIDDKKEDKKELTAQEKSQLRDSYKKTFKAAMVKCKFTNKSFDDLTLTEKVKFFTEIDKVWKNKPDPSEFLSDTETEQLEKIVIK